jgi:hypothetical protein
MVRLYRQELGNVLAPAGRSEVQGVRARGQRREQEPVADCNTVLLRPGNARIRDCILERVICREPEQRGRSPVVREASERRSVDLGEQFRGIRQVILQEFIAGPLEEVL